MLTEIQQIILTCLLGPEDKTAWLRASRQRASKAWKGRNPEKVQQREKSRWANDRPHQQARKRAWGARNPGYYTAKFREWKNKNRELHRANCRARHQRSCASDPQYRVRHNLRARVALALAGTRKSAPTLKLLGCTVSELRAHLEKQFRPGMTWENYGPVWHIDHVRPCASFDLTDPAQQRICFNWSNLQPLLAEENYKKGAR